MVKPWTCQRDGACCRIPEAVTMTYAEWMAIEAHPGRSGRRVNAERQPDNMIRLTAAPCPFLGASGACDVYEARPLQCRRFMCGRSDVAAQPFEDVAVPMVIVKNRDLRRQYALNQRKAMQSWGHAHGWGA